MLDYPKYSREELIDIIEKLSYDKAFGILTRTGLEIKMEGDYNCLFIDFDNIHYLNHCIGYNAVNNIIKTILNPCKSQFVLIGRLFSGDEIVMLTKQDNILKIYNQLRIEAIKFNMGFHYKILYNIKNLEEI
jgi:hypothetical protein